MNNSVVRHFDRAAAVFQTEAGVQGEIAKSLMRLASAALSPKTIVDMGAGGGFLTELLMQRFPQAGIDAVDLSPKMIERLNKRFGAESRFKGCLADGRSFGQNGCYDLLASSASLQWMIPIDETLTAWRDRMRPGGNMLVAVMVDGTLGELHRLRRELFSDTKTPRALASEAEILAMFTRAGLGVEESFVQSFVQDFECTDELLVSIRRQGYTGGEYSLGKQPLSRRDLLRLCIENDRRNRDASGRVNAQFQVLFALAKKE